MAETAPSKPGEIVFRPEPTNALQEELERQLLAIPGVVGFHRSGSGQLDELVVMVRDAASARNLPAHIAGMKVRTKVTGTIRSY